MSSAKQRGSGTSENLSSFLATSIVADFIIIIIIINSLIIIISSCYLDYTYKVSNAIKRKTSRSSLLHNLNLLGGHSRPQLCRFFAQSLLPFLFGFLRFIGLVTRHVLDVLKRYRVLRETNTITLLLLMTFLFSKPVGTSLRHNRRDFQHD